MKTTDGGDSGDAVSDHVSDGWSDEESDDGEDGGSWKDLFHQKVRGGHAEIHSAVLFQFLLALRPCSRAVRADTVCMRGSNVPTLGYVDRYLCCHAVCCCC